VRAVHRHRPLLDVLARPFLGTDAAVADEAQPAGFVQQFQREGGIAFVEFTQPGAFGLEDAAQAATTA